MFRATQVVYRLLPRLGRSGSRQYLGQPSYPYYIRHAIPNSINPMRTSVCTQKKPGANAGHGDRPIAVGYLLCRCSLATSILVLVTESFARLFLNALTILPSRCLSRLFLVRALSAGRRHVAFIATAESVRGTVQPLVSDLSIMSVDLLTTRLHANRCCISTFPRDVRYDDMRASIRHRTTCGC